MTYQSGTLSQDQIPRYSIYRDILPGAPYDPTAPLLFFPPKGSDALFDALRLEFPHIQNHSDRIQDAIVKFLLEEEEARLAYDQVFLASSWSAMSAQSQASTLDPMWDPDLCPSLGSASPVSTTSILDRSPTSGSVPAASRTSPVPSQDELTGVFSLNLSVPAKQHTRRKMTEAEKVAYRKRRIVKACEKCAKRKRKCIHSQNEIAQVDPQDSKASPSLLYSITEKEFRIGMETSTFFERNTDAIDAFWCNEFNLFSGSQRGIR